MGRQNKGSKVEKRGWVNLVELRERFWGTRTTTDMSQRDGGLSVWKLASDNWHVTLFRQCYVDSHKKCVLFSTFPSILCAALYENRYCISHSTGSWFIVDTNLGILLQTQMCSCKVIHASTQEEGLYFLVFMKYSSRRGNIGHRSC